MRRKNGFTLIEMLVVIAIAMILMGIGASSYQKMKHSNSLSTSSLTVQGALQSARAQAMKLNKVVRVFFLDGGLNTANYNGSDPDEYLLAITTYEVPYELVTRTVDGKELARDALPEGYGWISLGQGAGSANNVNNAVCMADPQDDGSGNYYPAGLNQGRNCSLIINFSPSGAAWADKAFYRSSNSVNNIRVFNIDKIEDEDGENLPLYNISVPNPLKEGSETRSPSGINTFGARNMWKAVGTGDTQRIDNINHWGSGSSKNSIPREENAMKDSQIFWHTIKMNYNTGLSSITYNQNE